MAEMINKSEFTMEDFHKEHSATLPALQQQDLSGKVVIVTGANVGIGFETAKAIASMKPKKLILACRNSEKAQEALKRIVDATGFRDIEAWSLDLASFASVQAFAKRFLDSGMALDILVSNAGLGAPAWEETEDGYEIAMQVNHLANVLMIGLLYPAFKKAKQDKAAHFPRVNVVASGVHFWAHIPLNNDPHPVQSLLKKPETFGGFGNYMSSKMCNVLFAKAWAARCQDVWICSSNPGYTDTELGKKEAKSGAAKAADVPSDPMGVAKWPTEVGARTIIEASVSPKVGESGGYYSSMVEARTRSDTTGEVGKKFADNVWNDTVSILKKHVPQVEIYNW